MESQPGAGEKREPGVLTAALVRRASNLTKQPRDKREIDVPLMPLRNVRRCVLVPRRREVRFTLTVVLTGGCECGAVGYELQAEPDALSVAGRTTSAHLFGATVRVHTGDFAWVRGTASTYALPGNGGERSFCGCCGTPLSYSANGKDPWVHVARDSFDGASLTDIFAMNGDAAVHNPQPGLNKERR